MKSPLPTLQKCNSKKLSFKCQCQVCRLRFGKRPHQISIYRSIRIYLHISEELLLILESSSHYPCFSNDLYCLSRVSMNSLVFTSRWQLVERKPNPTLLLTQGIINLPHHVDMVWGQLAFDDTVSYTQWWKYKLAEVMAIVAYFSSKMSVNCLVHVCPPYRKALSGPNRHRWDS